MTRMKIRIATPENLSEEWTLLRRRIIRARSAKMRQIYESRYKAIEEDMDRRYVESYTLMPETDNEHEWDEFWPKTK